MIILGCIAICKSSCDESCFKVIDTDNSRKHYTKFGYDPNYAATQVNYQAPPKNRECVSISEGASRNNREAIDTSEVLEYISIAMATLSAFERRLKTQASTNPIHSEL